MSTWTARRFLIGNIRKLNATSTWSTLYVLDGQTDIHCAESPPAGVAWRAHLCEIVTIRKGDPIFARRALRVCSSGAGYRRSKAHPAVSTLGTASVWSVQVVTELTGRTVCTFKVHITLFTAVPSPAQCTIAGSTASSVEWHTALPTEVAEAAGALATRLAKIGRCASARAVVVTITMEVADAAGTFIALQPLPARVAVAATLG